MAKKTRKEKIIAEQRRKLLVLQTSQSSNTLSYKPTYSVPNIQKSTVFAPPEHYDHVKPDLSRTLTLTMLAIAAQLCVYYLMEVRHMKFF